MFIIPRDENKKRANQNEINMHNLYCYTPVLEKFPSNSFVGTKNCEVFH